MLSTDTLSEKKRKLFAKLLQGKKPDGFPRRPADAPARLSLAQERLWALEERHPGLAVYHEPRTIRIRGPLDPAALEMALAEIVRRHEVLRCGIENRDGAAIQQPSETPFALERAAVTEEELASRALEYSVRPFDLHRGPVLRAVLFELGPAHHVLHVVIHHLAFDDQSASVLTRELGALYRAFAAGRPSPLAPLPIQYADFAHWQRGLEAEQRADRALAYWRETLQGGPAALDLPTDFPRPPVATYRGGRYDFRLSPGTAQAARELASAHGATEFEVLMAVLQGLLARHSGQADVVVGTPVSGRVHRALESLIGSFAQPVPIRGRRPATKSLHDLLPETREAVRQAAAHAELPFERLVETLTVERDPSRAPIFQVLFAHQRGSPGALELPGLSVEPLALGVRGSKYDFSCFTAEEADGGMSACFEYRSDLFSPQTMARLAGRFTRLLETALVFPGEPLVDLPMLAGGEEASLFLFNATARNYPSPRLLPERVRLAAARNPAAPAVRYGERELSYGELDREANRLAHRLRRHGVRADVPVGIYAERSIEMAVGLLGILKAGGAYLPLDPSEPDDRLALMIEEARPPVILAQSRYLLRLTNYSGKVIALEGELFPEPSTPVETAGVGARNLAYVIYTSGSTGRPKGVMLPHTALDNLLEWIQENYAYSGSDRILQKTPLSFDVSAWEFFATWNAGSCLVMASPEGHRDPSYLIDIIARERITALHFVPPMLDAFLDTFAARGGDLSTLRHVICIGQELRSATAETFRRVLPHCELHNLYGPTEAAVIMTAWKYDGQARGQLPIGQPIANTEAWILDSRGRQCPIGVPGELAIGGVCLARGYLGRPELTAEKFVPHPYRPDQRLYLTGDRARYLADGNLELLGRLDYQIKIGGVRIEPSEIEHVMSLHPRIRQSVVVARPQADGEYQLAAYLAADPWENWENELRAALRERLPAVMIPPTFVRLDTLPLTASGKIDRKALPAPVPT